ncbi:hypothetical protein [Oscillibacter sp. MSJ-31]|uniref:hypothetical protein n=1 Tax=Oscillibacter sp. MSJ-31 TaxID=2841526 RepID=UPI001C1014CF|nr:hypothetical protein [Oscillibacter sp. MSJ-31]MBU5457589.1 hypothetical protein [Oscillibacter sp. MSJ-31]
MTILKILFSKTAKPLKTKGFFANASFVWEEYELFFDYFPKLPYNLGKTLIYQAFQPFPYLFFDAKSNPFWSYHAEL